MDAATHGLGLARITRERLDRLRRNPVAVPPVPLRGRTLSVDGLRPT